MATDTDQVSVTFECKECGGTVLELPDDYTEDSIAKCKACGVEFGRWRDIKAKSVEAVKADFMAKARDAFKGWNVN